MPLSEAGGEVPEAVGPGQGPQHAPYRSLAAGRHSSCVRPPGGRRHGAVPHAQRLPPARFLSTAPARRPSAQGGVSLLTTSRGAVSSQGRAGQRWRPSAGPGRVRPYSLSSPAAPCWTTCRTGGGGGLQPWGGARRKFTGAETRHLRMSQPSASPAHSSGSSPLAGTPSQWAHPWFCPLRVLWGSLLGLPSWLLGLVLGGQSLVGPDKSCTAGAAAACLLVAH